MPADLPRVPCLMTGHTWCDRVLFDTVYEPLVRWDPEREAFVGLLAEAWRFGEKGHVFGLTLRRNVRWHDGKPFTAKDVKYSLDQLRATSGERDHPAAQRLLSLVEQVSFRSDYDVELRFTEPLGPVLELLASIPIRQAPPTDGDDGTTAAPSASTASEEETSVVGTGPFRFVQWWPGEKVVLGKWKAYWGTLARLDRVEFVVESSLSAVVERFRSGALDLVLDLDQSSYRQLLTRLGPTARNVLVEPAGFTLLLFNCRKGYFDEPLVRRALAHLIDREKLVSGLAGPRPVLMDGPVWRHGPQRRAALGTGPRHDPGAAAKLLKDAGWRLVKGHWTKDGQPLILRLQSAQESVGINRGLKVLARDLARHGVTLEVEKRLWGEMVRDLAQVKFSATLLVVPLSGPWTDLVELARTGAGVGFSHPASKPILERILKDTEPTRRLARERRIFQLLGRESPFVVLFAPRSLGLSRGELLSGGFTYTWFDLAKLELR